MARLCTCTALLGLVCSVFSATSQAGSIPEKTITKGLKEADANFDQLRSNQPTILWITLLEAGS